MLTNGRFCGKNLIYVKDVEGNLLLKDAPESRRAVRAGADGRKQSGS